MDNKEYKVSIILPVHNGERYLSSAIESIITQTYENIELIIIDDFSSDHSNKIAKSYAQKDSRVRVYRNKENKKLPRSLNAGFKMATGEFFTWTSDDNLLKPETIQALVEVFQKKPDVDFVYADIIPIDENGRVKKMSYLNGEVEDIYVFNPVLACFMYRREVHETLKGYNPNKFLYEDYDFWLRTYENGFNMYHLKRKLYFYRFHNNSLTTKKRKESDRIQIKLLLKNLKKEKQWKNKKKMVLKLLKMLKT